MKIKNADIIVSGIGLSDIYFNEDYLGINNNISNLKEHLAKKLCEVSDDELWCSNIENEGVDSLLKSYSSYKRLTKRDYLVGCKLKPVYYKPDIKINDTLGILEKLEESIFSLFKEEELFLSDINLKFYAYGNVTISGKFKIRDKTLSIEQYHNVSNFIHAFFGFALREIVTKIIIKYINIIQNFKEEYDPFLLEIPIQSDLGNNFMKILNNTLQFAIRTHFIYDTELKQTKSITCFRPVLLGEWEKALDNVLILEECIAYFGWSHSLYIFNDYDDEFNVKYTLPMEVVMSNWSALHCMQRRIENARIIFSERIDNKKYKNIKYEKVANDINDFMIKFERMIAYFDSYTVSNNPMYFHLIDLQKEAFYEKNHIERVKKKLLLLNRIVEELASKQKDIHDRKVNRVLFIITIFALLNSVQVTYELLMYDNRNDLYYILGIFLGLLCAIILYLRINGKK